MTHFILDVFSIYSAPKYRNIIPNNTSNKSKAFRFRFFSRKNIAPQRNDTMTLLLLTIDTTEISAPSRLRA